MDSNHHPVRDSEPYFLDQTYSHLNMNFDQKTEHHIRPTIRRTTCRKLSFIVITLFISIIVNCPPTCQQQQQQQQHHQQQQQNHCPKVCKCEDVELLINCQGSIGASGLPHTLNPSTKHMIINFANTSQFSQVDYLVKLETIDLAHNKISSIDFEVISNNLNLNSINASHNIISELKDGAVSSALSSRQGYANSASEMLNELSSLKLNKVNVVDLVLSHNQITSLKDFTFIRWAKLQRMDLSYNQLVSLDPYSLLGLHKLEMINLRGNRLTQIPTLALQSTTRSLSNTGPNSKQSSLKHLELGENMFTFIGRDSFTSLNKILELMLDSCSIQNIHDKAFESLNVIQSLSLDKNELTDVPATSFRYLRTLKLLKLSSNKINNLQRRSFEQLTDLEELQINNNTFGEIKAGALDGLDSLKKLELGHNSNLRSIRKGSFVNIPKLIFLSLNSNSLATVPDDFTRQISRIPIIDLRANPLYCGCDLKWLTRWLRKFKETSQIHQEISLYSSQNGHKTEEIVLQTDPLFITNEVLNITCSNPPALKGRLIAELPENKLECIEPTSDLNVSIGYASLFFVTILMGVVCLVNFFRNKHYLFTKLKENLVQNHMSMMMPYSQDLPSNTADMKKEADAHFYGSDYEHVDTQQFGPVYTINEDHIMYCETQDIK